MGRVREGTFETVGKCPKHVLAILVLLKFIFSKEA